MTLCNDCGIPHPRHLLKKVPYLKKADTRNKFKPATPKLYYQSVFVGADGRRWNGHQCPECKYRSGTA